MRRSQTLYIIGSVMFVGALVMVICAFAGTTGSSAVDGRLPIMDIILAVGFLVTGGLFYVAGAILAAAEHFAERKAHQPGSRAEPGSAASGGS